MHLVGKVTLPSRAIAKAVSDQWAVSGAVAKGKVGLPNRAVAKAVADQPRKVAMVVLLGKVILPKKGTAKCVGECGDLIRAA